MTGEKAGSYGYSNITQEKVNVAWSYLPKKLHEFYAVRENMN